MCTSLLARAGQDPAISEQERQFLRKQLTSVPRAMSLQHYATHEVGARIDANYLERWSAAIGASHKPPRVELFARSIASHLLDAGFSGQYMHRFIKNKLNEAGQFSLAQLCEALHAEMVSNPQRKFEVLLAYSALPRFPNGIPDSWRQGAQTTAWLRENGFDVAGIRAPASMIIEVSARDPAGAANAARSESDRFAARALIATGEPLHRIPKVWVKGASEPTSTAHDLRGVGVKELFREDRVFSSDVTHGVDAALELLAHMEGSSPPAAIAGGWAAIEGLLGASNDRSSAAQNLASLVACSFPRAELTALSYEAEKSHPQQCSALARQTSNRERSRLLAEMIIQDQLPEMPRLADQAAVVRLKKLFRDPAEELKTIRELVANSFYRLYRQRNLVLHAGRLDSVALPASLRTIAKLAGAGLDRITHGHYVQGLQPLELVARANLALATIAKDKPLDCVDLLEVGD